MLYNWRITIHLKNCILLGVVAFFPFCARGMPFSWTQGNHLCHVTGKTCWFDPYSTSMHTFGRIHIPHWIKKVIFLRHIVWSYDTTCSMALCIQMLIQPIFVSIFYLILLTRYHRILIYLLCFLEETAMKWESSYSTMHKKIVNIFNLPCRL